MQIVLLESLIGYFVKLRAEQLGVLLDEVVLHLGDARVPIQFQQDELVRDNSDLLQRKSLHRRSWESFQDPRGFVLFQRHDLLLDQINNNIIRS